MQVLSNMIDYGMEPQAALDAPRFSVEGVDSAYGPACVEHSRFSLSSLLSTRTLPAPPPSGVPLPILPGSLAPESSKLPYRRIPYFDPPGPPTLNPSSPLVGTSSPNKNLIRAIIVDILYWLARLQLFTMLHAFTCMRMSSHMSGCAHLDA